MEATSPDAAYAPLQEYGLVRAAGSDATAFLQAQLTSDVRALIGASTQYSGYCSPKGRLFATMLLWGGTDEVLLQMPAILCESIRARLARYVLRSKVTVVDATGDYKLFGLWGSGSAAAAEALVGSAPAEDHGVVSAGDVAIARLGSDRFLIRGSVSSASSVVRELARHAAQAAELAWAVSEIQAGVPVITPPTQEQFVPQMVNLDLIGGVSYSKGCYPGQEIVARTHYLGRLKQRMHRIHFDGSESPAAGDALFSRHFAPDQSSGTIVNAAPSAQGGFEALAVVQTASIQAGPLHWRSPDGPAVEVQPLPYAVPL